MGELMWSQTIWMGVNELFFLPLRIIAKTMLVEGLLVMSHKLFVNIIEIGCKRFMIEGVLLQDWLLSFISSPFIFAIPPPVPLTVPPILQNIPSFPVFPSSSSNQSLLSLCLSWFSPLVPNCEGLSHLFLKSSLICCCLPSLKLVSAMAVPGQ